MSDDQKRRLRFFEGYRQSPAKYAVTCVLLVGFIALAIGGVALDLGGRVFWLIATVALFIVIQWRLSRHTWLWRRASLDAVGRARRRRETLGGMTLAGLWSVVAGAVMLICAITLTWGALGSAPQPPPPNATPESHEMYQRYLRVHQYCEREQWYMYGKVSLVPLGALAFTILMFFLWRRAGRAVRRAEGRCERCGYSLQGLPEPRCPECGTPFTPSSAADRLRPVTDAHGGSLPELPRQQGGRGQDGRDDQPA